MEKDTVTVNKVIDMYSLYDCDAWRDTSSMSLEYETLERSAMNAKIKNILLSEPEAFELTKYLHSDEKDKLNEFEEADDVLGKENFFEEKLDQLPDRNSALDLVDMVKQQQIDYLYLEVRELDLEHLTVEGGSIQDNKTVELVGQYFKDYKRKKPY